jgi:hypothetical protein
MRTNKWAQGPLDLGTYRAQKEFDKAMFKVNCASYTLADLMADNRPTDSMIVSCYTLMLEGVKDAERAAQAVIDSIEDRHVEG